MRLQLYITKQVLSAFTFAVAALLFVALPGIVVSAVHKLPNVAPALLLHYLPIVLEGLAPYLLPVCFMLAVTGVYGRLASDREWIAIQMSGLNPLRCFVPGLVLALLLSAGTFWMLSEELPKLKEREKRFLIGAAASVIENLQPGRTSISLGDFYLKAADRDEQTGTFFDAYIRVPEGESLQGDVFASTVDIRIQGSHLYAHLTDLEIFDPRGGVSARLGEAELEFDLADRVSQAPRDSHKPRYRTSGEILSALRAGTVDPEYRRDYALEFHRRTALSLSYVLFLGLGAPTGILLRRGTRLGALAVATVYGLLYHVFSTQIGSELGKARSLAVWIGPWVTTFIGLAVSLVLVRRAIRR
ncbi:MAG: LptF/LptG family permease [Planctomycetota bacterium]